jgi:hypothetical protein
MSRALHKIYQRSGAHVINKFSTAPRCLKGQLLMKKAQRGGSEGCRSITEMVPLILDDLSQVIYKIHHCPAHVATRKGENSEKFTLCRLKSSFFYTF